MQRALLTIMICVALLAACNPARLTPPASRPESGPVATELPPTSQATETPLLDLPTVTLPPLTETATLSPPTQTALPACVTLHYGGNAQFEIVDLSAQRILVDVYDPEKLASPVIESDVLLTTHTHWDHVNQGFQAAFPGPQLFVQTGRLDLPGITIQGIASAHNQGDTLKPEGGTNYLYVIDLGGVRIVHFGDIGQNALTAEQLSALWPVDVALMQLNNPYSEMSAENRKGINLIEQVQPRLIIPTHLNLDTAKLAVALWPGWYRQASSVQVCQSDFADETQILFLGEAAETMVRYLDLMEWGEAKE